jgi:nucleotide-binding universal stress UspA family protein
LERILVATDGSEASWNAVNVGLELARSCSSKLVIMVHRGEEPYVEIVDEAFKNKVDMIVMGTHGRRGIKRLVMGSHGRTGLMSLLMGSVTERVLGHGESLIFRARSRLKQLVKASPGNPPQSKAGP